MPDAPDDPSLVHQETSCSLVSRRAFLAASSFALGSALAPGLLAEISAGASVGSHATTSARETLSRLLGARASDFDLAWIPSEDHHEVYEISASQGRVRLRGSSGVALCRGAYAYLRETCNVMVAWSGQHCVLPARFPDFSARRVLCPYQFVQYYNPCSFGYTTAFWNWERWQRELDWMALHGITMPLAMEGQEAIWQRVWLQMGVAQEELDRSSTGPGHLPWHRMGNIDNFDGPLPQGWIEQKKELQKKILDRMRKLGMSPVVPAFSGFVPEGFKRVFPQAKTYTEFWLPKQQMPRESMTFILDPDEADFYREIGGRFIREYKREFGPTQHYLVDTFNELAVPVTAGHRYEDLARFAHTVFEGILAGDPKGTWVMQGWLFRNDPKFWDNASIQAFLASVPSDRMMILDYTGDSEAKNKDAAADPFAHNEWKNHNAFFGKQWINGMIHTFGGNNNVKGNLALIAAQSAGVLASPERGNLIGWSMNPEGIETNEVVYELMTDIGWSEKKIDLDTWIVSYCHARYGACPPAMQAAWSLLRQSAYSWHKWTSHHAWQARPNLNPAATNVDSGPVFRQAVEHFLSCSDQLGSGELYRNDLIELVAQSVGGSVDAHLLEACKAHTAGLPEVRDRKAKESLEMLLRIDGLMNVRADRHLETWTEAARSWGTTSDIKAYYDANARRLITFWGWVELNDYASRVWSGLIRDYYVGRWQAFFQSLRDNRPPALDIWEETWLSSPYKPSAPMQVGNVAAESRRMLDTCAQWT